MRGHDGWVSEVAFSPDGSLLASGGADGAVRLWHVSTHLPADPPLPSHKGSVSAMEFSPDGRRIASMSILIGSDPTDSATSADGTRTPSGASQLRITDVDSGGPLVDGLTEFGYGGYDLAFSPDGRRVAIGASDGRIRVRDADNGGRSGRPSAVTPGPSAPWPTVSTARGSSAAATIRSMYGQPNPVERSGQRCPAWPLSARRRPLSVLTGAPSRHATRTTSPTSRSGGPTPVTSSARFRPTTSDRSPPWHGDRMGRPSRRRAVPTIRSGSGMRWPVSPRDRP